MTVEGCPTGRRRHIWGVDAASRLSFVLLTSWCLALIIPSRSLIRCRVSSFVRGAGSTGFFRPFFVLPFRPLFVLLVVVALLALELLAEIDVLSAKFSGEACRGGQTWGIQGRIAGSRPIFVCV